MGFLIVGGVLVIGAILFWQQLKMVLRYIPSIFIKNISDTPEGAEAIYNEMIEKAEEQYKIAVEALKNISEQHRAQLGLKHSLESSISQSESECESLVKKGKLEEAKMMSDQRQFYLNKLYTCTDTLERLELAEKDANEAARICENNLEKLKSEKQITIQEIIINNNLTNAYNSLDRIKKETTSEKLLDALEDNAKHKAAMAAGAKAVYELKNPAGPLDEPVNESDDYLKGLVDKYSDKKGNGKIKKDKL